MEKIGSITNFLKVISADLVDLSLFIINRDLTDEQNSVFEQLTILIRKFKEGAIFMMPNRVY
jgi:hypothetical protein